MSLESVEIWVEQLKKRGIKTFESKDLPEELRDRTMIIRAKYAGAIIKVRTSTSTLHSQNKWEII